MRTIAVPMYRADERPNPRPRRPKNRGERAVEIYFAFLTFLILGMIIGLGAYTILSLIPAWQRFLSSQERPHYLYMGPRPSQFK